MKHMSCMPSSWSVSIVASAALHSAMVVSCQRIWDTSLCAIPPVGRYEFCHPEVQRSGRQTWGNQTFGVAPCPQTGHGFVTWATQRGYIECSNRSRSFARAPPTHAVASSTTPRRNNRTTTRAGSEDEVLFNRNNTCDFIDMSDLHRPLYHQR